MNIHGAPFDFRKAANEHQKYFEDLQALIEDTYEKVGLYKCQRTIRRTKSASEW